MNPIDPIRPSSLDGIVDHIESGRAYASYSPVSEYEPYQWEMPWIETPLPSVPPFNEPFPEPQQPPSYDDCLLTPEIFSKAMRDLSG